MKRFFSISFTFLIFCFCGQIANAQQEYKTKSKKAIKAFEEGLRFYDAKRNSEAIVLFEKAVKADIKFIDPYILLAESHFELGEAEIGIDYFKKVIQLNASHFKNTYYRLAQMQLSIGQYQDAKESLQLFSRVKGVHPKIKESSELSMKTADFGSKAVLNPVPFNPKNLGESVNTDQYEYFPVLTADEQTLIFTRNQRRFSDTDYQEDFYASSRKEDEWGTAINMGEPINTTDNEGAQTITADGTQIFFTGCNRKVGLGSCDIYTSKKEGGRWTAPVNLGAPVNSSKWESQPSISADGKTLYFASNRPGGRGQSDIWVAHLQQNGNWTVPKNLGNVINTPNSEETPFIHTDGRTLYFTSDGHPGLGKKDIFMTRINDSGVWSEPKNLGYPINTWNDESGLFVASNGEMAYFGSNREGGFGQLDLYAFPLYKEAQPIRVTYVAGTVKDKVSGKPLGARFELIDLSTNKLVVESNSDKLTGEFLVTLPVNRDYALNVSKDGYLFYSEHFSLKQ
ncbi:CDC27 family protein, partial [Bacteroidota bacterium]